MAKLANIIKILNQDQIEMNTDSIGDLYDYCTEQKWGAKQLLNKDT